MRRDLAIITALFSLAFCPAVGAQPIPRALEGIVVKPPPSYGPAYVARLMAAIKPNIVVVDPVPKDARAEVEITTEPNGRIAGHSLLKASSVQAWDEAVMKAVAMTERLPLAPDGTIPPRMHVIFRLDAP